MNEMFRSRASATTDQPRQTHVRYLILAMLFGITLINYADRSAISIVGPALRDDLGINSVTMGYIFSAFSWAYVIAQLPGGWLLDRFGSRRVYAAGILLWSTFTFFQGTAGAFTAGAAVIVLFVLRFLVGLAESPSFPGNSRIVASWFPLQERGRAATIFNSAQYFATVLFAPIMGALTYHFGWEATFFVMGALGVVCFFIWLVVVHAPRDHQRANEAEVAYIAEGGALVDMDHDSRTQTSQRGHTGRTLRRLLSSRMLVGIYISQYCFNALTWFFLTWFPVYLVDARGMNILEAGFVASIPAVCGFAGGILSGVFSDMMLRRGHSLTAARKTPIVLGMTLSTSMLICNYIDIDWLIVAIMALAFFGKGFGGLGWAIMSDVAPKEASGLSGGLFNMFGNCSGIVTPIAIGYIVNDTGSFNGALIFVIAHALTAVFSYLFIVGRIERIRFD
ncbi:ACS family glucarate transporter-like MFS transporter [Kushneria sinocarnis]|uniref:ACS family glucarate transporter-like MFS transporter n=2 Tax=Kushneria TaxID=504090 RepID=A0A420X189_9GAMM|nr:MFS transporter [Kushneria sinocarnis]RKR07469.1 ACS family glucarate transporter-like MFS transporter [Kushneria sinocarnis]